eukprot:TRINITY_DN273_c0_g1_i1.p1 TRINITY_DN273_c0_g1~~TRINITY_DN273_c0_g1_i1.p1  ORF type:complete len:317 (+),score=51.95 TRINITY_DN273_c0_g1_i1:401-1351(+)
MIIIMVVNHRELSSYLSILTTIHDENMVRFLLQVCPHSPALPGWISLRDQCCTPIDPSKFSRPEQIGYYCCDRLTPFDQKAIYSAVQSFHTAVKAAEAANQTHITYAICRTPGHHAAFETMGGFCYFNNAMGAVFTIRKKLGKDALIVVVDIDRHHGNGTESILRRLQESSHFEKVAFISTHQDPSLGYEPVFSGHATDLDGLDPLSPPKIINLPYDPLGVSGSVPNHLVSKVDEILTALSPQAIVVSLGVDALDSDPVDPGGWPIETFDAFGSVIGKHAKTAQIVMGVHEGGYDDQRCGECSQRFWSAVIQHRDN